MATDDTILGVERDILEKALLIFRDRYHLATQANLVLELYAGTSGINVSITNQRDAVTHLVSLLKADGDRDAQVTQVGNLDEHLRRAVSEPYELAVNVLEDRLATVLQQYKEEVLSLEGYRAVLPGAPTLEELSTMTAAITRQRLEGRFAKTENVWSADYGEGIAKFIGALQALSDLRSRLEVYIAQARQLRTAQSSSRQNWLLMILGAVVSAILGAILAAVLL
jgi:hypothetical protein